MNKKDMYDEILPGNSLITLQRLPADSVDCIVTMPTIFRAKRLWCGWTNWQWIKTIRIY